MRAADKRVQQAAHRKKNTQTMLQDAGCGGANTQVARLHGDRQYKHSGGRGWSSFGPGCCIAHSLDLPSKKALQVETKKALPVMPCFHLHLILQVTGLLCCRTVLCQSA